MPPFSDRIRIAGTGKHRGAAGRALDLRRTRPGTAQLLHGCPCRHSLQSRHPHLLRPPSRRRQAQESRHRRLHARRRGVACRAREIFFEYPCAAACLVRADGRFGAEARPSARGRIAPLPGTRLDHRTAYSSVRGKPRLKPSKPLNSRAPLMPWSRRLLLKITWTCWACSAKRRTGWTNSRSSCSWYS